MNLTPKLLRRYMRLEHDFVKRNIHRSVQSDLNERGLDLLKAAVSIMHTMSLDHEILVDLPFLQYVRWLLFREGKEIIPDQLTLNFYLLTERAARADPEQGDHTRKYALPPYVVNAILEYGLPLDRDCEDCGMLLPERWWVKSRKKRDFSRCCECGGRVGKDLYKIKHGVAKQENVVEISQENNVRTAQVNEIETPHESKVRPARENKIAPLQEKEGELQKDYELEPCFGPTL